MKRIGNLINLAIFQDEKLPKRTIAVSSEIYSMYKDKKLGILKNPVISSNSVLSDINIIEQSNLNNETCLASTDIIVITGCDYNGDVIAIFQIEERN